ncbi:uncharacterized protein YdhG (YjbR/CyaY superfamily) [Conyzicola lurida]|uniref:Uncharacterized protein YdhG (YjbR/CyaY superfamily) n=1 Tax=Conyzicola lurida TaxID=1172621 RepID=A0A841AL98_9MICO|nr:DUF1801 domain-containing protein [Conyzicola lurida]MBB5842403.1 uncharacterized protein YdhG (YjbR/CyaY superfamily) [Conyzicola lurida]
MAEKSTKSGFTAEERAAMKERAKELKTAQTNAEALAAQLEKIAELPPADRALAEGIHEIVTENAPTLTAKLWYGMPGYALDGKILCFFQSAEKFGSRYSTLGFNDVATLDDGELWPTAFAVTELTPAVKKTIAELVKKAVS